MKICPKDTERETSEQMELQGIYVYFYRGHRNRISLSNQDVVLGSHRAIGYKYYQYTRRINREAEKLVRDYWDKVLSK